MADYAAGILPPRTLTDNEIARLLKVTGEHRAGFRDHVIVSLGLGAGLREHEIAGLDVGDVMHGDGRIRRRIQLRVFKRSNPNLADQQVLVPDALAYKLGRFMQWKRSGGESLDADAPLFVSRRGKRISTRTIRHAFRTWQQRAGFDRLLGFHSLRHTAATSLYRRTKDLRLTQRFCRHRSVLSSQVYAGPTDQDLVEALRDQPC